MSVDQKGPEFTPPLPLPVPEPAKVVSEVPKKVSIDLNPQHSAQKHLKAVDTGGLFADSATAAAVSPSGPILKRRSQSERILEPHVVHIRKTETGETSQLPLCHSFVKLFDCQII